MKQNFGEYREGTYRGTPDYIINDKEIGIKSHSVIQSVTSPYFNNNLSQSTSSNFIIPESVSTTPHILNSNSWQASSIYYTKDQILGKIKTAWDKIEVLNEQIKNADDNALQSTLIRVKNDICKEFWQFCSEKSFDVNSILSTTGYYRQHETNGSKPEVTKVNRSKEEEEKLEKFWGELKELNRLYSNEQTKFWNVLHQEEIKDKTD